MDNGCPIDHEQEQAYINREYGAHQAIDDFDQKLSGKCVKRFHMYLSALRLS